jgi:hypothetical protein
MTLAQQFPDVSMLIRAKRKPNLKYNVATSYNYIRYAPISADQKFYDKEFRIFHVKLLSMIAVLVAALFLLILNGEGAWNWIVSQIR